MLLFLSHSGADSDGARELALRLREAGLEVWLDLDHLQPGDRWMSVLEEALRGADAFAVYVGADGIQRWVDREVRAALERSVAHPSFRIVPVLAPGSDPAALPTFLAQHQFVDLRRDTSPEELKRLVGAVLARPPEAVSLLAPGTAPFRGLEYFDVEHAHLYFGRDRETAALVEKMRADRFLAVVGASGSGKSSLVRAGLVPALHRGRTEDGGSWGGRWRVAVFRPGDDPFRELAFALPDLSPELSGAARIGIIETCRAALKSGDLGLQNSIAGLVPPGQRTLLVVDQLEELFTHGSLPGERRRLVDSLLRVADAGGDRPVHVVATLRADFYSRCWEHPELPGRIARNQHAVRPLGRDERREVVEKPLALAGASFEPGLADRVLDDAGEEPGNLPLVEHALLQLWERRRGGTLTHAAYEEIGGISGALAHHADAVFDGLDDTGKAIAEKVFLRLTTPGEGTEDTRRRAARDEVVELGADEAVAERVLGSLADARLVVTRREGNSDVVEVAHEALIREWPRLRGWLDMHRDAIRVERRLMDDAAEWERLGEDPDALLRGAHLAEAEQWAAGNGDDLRPREREFLAASVEARDHAAREAEERRQRELEMARRLSEEAEARAVAEREAAEGAQRSARRTGRLARGLALVSVAALGIGAFAFFQWQRSEQRTAEAESRELAAQAMSTLSFDPSEALLLAIQAANRAPTFEADDVLRQALAAPTTHVVLSGHLGPVYNAAFSPDGQQIVTASDNSKAYIWNVATGQVIDSLVGHRGSIWTAGFSPDGKFIVTASVDRTARIWDVKTYRSVAILRGHEDAVVAASFSPDGKSVATASTDGTARIWDLTTKRPRILRHDNVWSVAFSPVRERRQVVTAGSGGYALVWDLEKGTATDTLRGREGAPWTAAFDHAGRHVATAAEGGAVLIWDLVSRQPPDTLEGHSADVIHAAFSRDGKQIVTASEDGTARVWDVASGRTTNVLRGHTNILWSATFSLDGRRVATTSMDGTARIWDITSDRAVGILQGHLSFVTTANFSPDGKRVVTSGIDGTARVWDVVSLQTTDSLPLRLDWVSSATFLPNDRLVFTANTQNTILVWDLALRRATDTLYAGRYNGYAVAAISANGRYVAANTDSITTLVWDLASKRARDTLHGPRNGVSILGISRDGQRVVTAGEDGTTIVWSLAEHAADTLRMHRKAITAVAFSADGRRIATASEDSTVLVWDAVNGKGQGVLVRHRGHVSSVRFSPDGRHIVTASDDGVARVFDANTGKSLTILRGHEGLVYTAEFSPDGKRVVTASQDGNARIFPIATDELLKIARTRIPVTLAPARRDSLLGRSGKRNWIARLFRT